MSEKKHTQLMRYHPVIEAILNRQIPRYEPPLPQEGNPPRPYQDVLQQNSLRPENVAIPRHKPPVPQQTTDDILNTLLGGG
jgi:hypothetical protein